MTADLAARTITRVVYARIPARVLLEDLLHLEGGALVGASTMAAADGGPELVLYLDVPGAPERAAELLVPVADGEGPVWKTRFGAVVGEP